MSLVVIRGIGDIGSAVAHRLFRADYTVVLHDNAQPATTRRRMAFADAMFDGETTLADVRACRLDTLDRLPSVLADRQWIPVVVADFTSLLGAITPQIVIDARMRKRTHPEDMRGLAPLTLGLGPNFVAGENVDIAIETSWENLGAVVEQGPTLPFGGEPRELGGHARERYVYAPVEGLFVTHAAIGDRVEAGEVVAAIDGTPLHAPLSGILRGLTHSGVGVAPATKVIEIDPRGRLDGVSGIAERPGRIADGLLAAVQARCPA